MASNEQHRFAYEVSVLDRAEGGLGIGEVVRRRW
jgi:hypothetical protein